MHWRTMVLAMVLAQSASAGELNTSGMVSRLDTVEWVGDWFVDQERSITIFVLELGVLQVDGLATPGLLDPERIADGTLDEVTFRLIVPDRVIYVNNSIRFKLMPDGTATVHDLTPDDCVLTMTLDWNINWIDVSENDNCASHRVSFAGRYDYRPIAWND